MRHTLSLLMIVGALALSPVAIAAAPQKSAGSTKTTAMSHSGSHAVRGVVKSMDDSTLVVTPSGKKTDMTFALNQATTKEGSPAVGSMVSVRYKTEAGKNVATAVAVQSAKTGKSKNGK